MRRFALAISAVFATILLTAAGQQAPQRLYRAYSEEQRADLDKVSAYLNSIRTLKSGFVQLGPEGQMEQGELFIEKPGRVRFAYNKPSPTLIVATGGTVYVKNASLNTVDHYDLSDTPLGLLLNDHVDLKTNKAVMGIVRQQGVLVVRARTSANRNDSNIELQFAAAPALELRQWTVRDNQGGTTTVALQNPEIGAEMPEGSFLVPTRNLVFKK
jgi:outer membrane lipoprotein-sorting protein